MWIWRFSRTTEPGRLRPASRRCSAGTSAPMRLELGPNLMVRPHSPPSTNRMVTLGAPNRRALVSAICCNAPSASPDELAIARRISALAVCRSRAARSWLFKLAVTDRVLATDLGLPDLGLPDWSFLDLGLADLSLLDLVRAGLRLPGPGLRTRFSRLVVEARFFTFFPRAAILAFPTKPYPIRPRAYSRRRAGP